MKNTDQLSITERRVLNQSVPNNCFQSQAVCKDQVDPARWSQQTRNPPEFDTSKRKWLI